MSLRARLIAAFAYLLVLTVAALSVPLGLSIERRARAEFESNLVRHAQAIGSSIADSVDDRERRVLNRLVTAYARELGGLVAVAGPSGSILASRGPKALFEAASVEVSDELVAPVGVSAEGALVVVAPVVSSGEVVGTVRVAESTGPLEERIGRSRLVLVAVGLFVIAVTMLVAALLAASLARPLRELARTAGRLGRGDLSARTEEKGPREVAEVATSLNAMAAELENTMAAQQDFVANASHQLRTPLTGIRLRLEGAVARGGEAGRYAEPALDEIDRLAELVDDLLVLARSSEPQTTGTDVDLGTAVRSAVARWTDRATQKSQLVSDRAQEGVVARSDPDAVAMILDNLLENAILHCPGQARIAAASFTGPDGPGIVVQDDGPGIPADELPHVFDRFYRGRRGRRAAPGTGLGLAIVNEVAQRWDGVAKIESSEEGTRVTVTWPSLTSS